MKLTIERGALLKSLAHAQSVVERRNTIPILGNVLLDARDGRLSVTATDMDLTIVEATPVSTSEPGSTTAPAHTLYDIARKLAEGAEVVIETKGDSGQIVLRSGRSTFTLSTLPTDEFPFAAGGELPHGFMLPARELRGLIDRTRFAISTEETRYYLNGIYLHATRSNKVPVMRAVATDGHRLARLEMPLPTGAQGMPGVIVPRKAVNEVRKLIDDMDADVGIALSEARIRFTIGDVTLTSKLIDGTFPDYERVIPTGNDRLLEVDCRPFAAAVDRVSTISSEKSRAVKLSVGSNSLVLSASSPDAGSAVEEIEVSYKSEPIEIGFNARYLLDITQQIEGDVAEFCFADAQAPTIIRDRADPSAIYVLMPMRV
ncbi:MAG: DNA polymerase III subunit beta [Alphaproteobacteria bacterium]|nr:DNA polymerase III subunit beta [Alphaproteobacteria bacterium]